MHLNDIINKHTIDPKRDIKPFLVLDKEYHGDADYKRCLNCNDTINNMTFPSVPWTCVQYCWACKHINVVYVGDRMGGQSDSIFCYKDK